MTRSNSLRYRGNGMAYTPGASPVRCVTCGVPFMAGFVPTNGDLVCKSCHEETEREDEAGLFALEYVRPSKRRERGGDSDPT